MIINPPLTTPVLPAGHFFRVVPHEDRYYNRRSPDFVSVQLRRRRRFWFSSLIDEDSCVYAYDARIHEAMEGLVKVMKAKAERAEALALLKAKQQKLCGDYPPKKL